MKNSHKLALINFNESPESVMPGSDEWSILLPLDHHQFHMVHVTPSHAHVLVLPLARSQRHWDGEHSR